MRVIDSWDCWPSAWPSRDRQGPLFEVLHYIRVLWRTPAGQALQQEEFGYTLASMEVVIPDPGTGTGNFIVNLIERLPGNAPEPRVRMSRHARSQCRTPSALPLRYRG